MLLEMRRRTHVQRKKLIFLIAKVNSTSLAENHFFKGRKPQNRVNSECTHSKVPENAFI